MRCFLRILVIQIGLMAVTTWSLGFWPSPLDKGSKSCHDTDTCREISESPKTFAISNAPLQPRKQRGEDKPSGRSTMRQYNKLQNRGQILGKFPQYLRQKQQTQSQSQPNERGGRTSNDQSQTELGALSQALTDKQGSTQKIWSALRPVRQTLGTPVKWLARTKDVVLSKGSSLFQKGKLLLGKPPTQDSSSQWKQNLAPSLLKLPYSDRKAAMTNAERRILPSSWDGPRLSKSITPKVTTISSKIDPISLRKVRSAPMLEDLPSIGAYAAEQKALSILKAGVPVGRVAKDSKVYAGGPMLGSFLTESEMEEKIKIYKSSNDAAHAYAQHQSTLARAYSDAAIMSMRANRPMRRARNEMKSNAAESESQAWRSLAKSSSYLAQLGQERLRHQRSLRREPAEFRRDLPDIGDVIRRAWEAALVDRHETEHRGRRDTLTENWYNTETIAEQRLNRHAQLRTAGGYDSDFDEPLTGIPHPRDNRHLLGKPFTPSPASSRGRLDYEEGPRRRLSSSSSGSGSWSGPGSGSGSGSANFGLSDVGG